jgi:hypothetical protein
MLKCYSKYCKGLSIAKQKCIFHNKSLVPLKPAIQKQTVNAKFTSYSKQIFLTFEIEIVYTSII